MARFKIVFNAKNGRVIKVQPPENYDDTYGEYEIENLTTAQIEDFFEPGTSWKQSRTVNFTHKPGGSICSIVIGGRLYRWC